MTQRICWMTDAMIFYDDLENDEADYPRKDFNFKAALDDLVAHSDDYQNSNEDEDEEEEEEE